jgi:cytochrome c2
MTKLSLPAAAVAALLLAAPAAVAQTTGAKTTTTTRSGGDAAAGAKTFAVRCAACHGKDAVGGTMAPSLRGVVGRKAATTAFPRYSVALKKSGLSWTPANLNTFIAGPQKMVKGTQMLIAVPNAADRQNLVAYLSTLKK